jgi:hypothetical protein
MMRRFSMVAVLCGLLLTVLSSCGEKSSDESKLPGIDAARVRAQVTELRQSSDALRAKIESAKEDSRAEQLRLESRVTEMLTDLDDLNQRIENVDNSVGVLARMESVVAKAPREKRGWPWMVSLLLLVFIVLSVALVVKRMGSDNEGEDDELLGDGFLEENELGSVRYPAEEEDSK